MAAAVYGHVGIVDVLLIAGSGINVTSNVRLDNWKSSRKRWKHVHWNGHYRIYLIYLYLSSSLFSASCCHHTIHYYSALVKFSHRSCTWCRMVRTTDRAGRARTPTHAHPVFDDKNSTPTHPAHWNNPKRRPPAHWACVSKTCPPTRPEGKRPNVTWGARSCQ